MILVGLALAQDYRFPVADEHISAMYPTAYKDHSGVDWACGSIRYSGHNGSDFGGGSFDGMEEGRDIVAAAAGTVTYAHDGEFDECTTGDCDGGGGFGNYVVIEHPDGKVTYYAHLKKWSVEVAAGDSVSCGTKVGEMGSSGYSTGPHLHFEVREGNVARDPFYGDCSSAPSYWVSQGSHGGVPGGVCEDVPECSPVARLSCGDERSGSNSAGASDHIVYGCSEWSYTGKELAFEVVTGLDEDVTVRMSGLSADLDLYVLEDAACDGSGCIGSSSESDESDESVTWGASADHVYVIVLDGWEGAISEFLLEVECVGVVETPDDSDAPDDSETPGDSESDSSVDEGREPKTLTPGERTALSGCGCGGGAPAGGLGLLAIGLLRRRRDR